jgi:branched-chain amino acid transport system substrate-binding protein
MRLSKIGVLASIGVLAFAACSSSTPAGSAAAGASGGTTGGTQPDVCKNKKGSSSSEIHIYSSLPRQGTNTEQTNTLVEQIKAVLDGQKIGNFTIKYTDLDDSSAANNGDWDGTVEQANANKVVADPDAMAYIGTYNSGAAKLAIPILNAACIVMVTPANTYPGLTKVVNGVTKPGEPDTYYPNGYRNYARVVGTDDAQGNAGALWAKTLGKTKAYVLDDSQVYGQGLARSFAIGFAKAGGTVLSANGTSESFDAKATDYSAIAQKIKSSGADMIYIGSITGQNTGKLWKDLRAAMPDITIMAGDGVFEKSWYDGVGSAGNGTYLTFGATGPDQLTGAGKDWYNKYLADHNGTSPAVYTAYGNAAATVVLAALQKAATNDRYEVLKNVMATKDLDTVTGKVTLDAGGDIVGGNLTDYQVVDKWPPQFKQLVASQGL